jgi:signal recognition particle receptor subunit beta
VAVLDVARKAITLKIVYYGCALGGKTTNLITLHGLTDPEGRHGLVSIATKDDRTLFFDLLPMDLGQIGGFSVRVKLYTIPGQVHYELTRRQVLSGADGIVLVIDSSPESNQANAWAWENLRFNLKANRLDPDEIPIVVQWNKRDLPDARPVAELQAELNPKGLPSNEAVATSGAGVVETFASIVKSSIRWAYAKTGAKGPATEQIEQIVDQTLAEARSREPGLPEKESLAFEHRVDNDAYRDDWAEKGRDRQILDQETLLSEAVQTGMELAEKLDGVRDVEEENRRRLDMLSALNGLTVPLMDAAGPPLPPGMMAALLRAGERTRGSILLFRRGEKTMEEREVVPAAPDPLNEAISPSVGSAAFQASQGEQPRFVEDLVAEIFFQAVPPSAEGLVSCFVAPLCCDRLRLGAMVVYAGINERPFGPDEKEFWTVASRVVGLALHWRGLRNKLAEASRAAVG